MSKTVRFKLGQVDMGKGKPVRDEMKFVQAVLDHMQGVMQLPPEDCTLDKFAKTATLEAARRYVSMIREIEEKAKQEREPIPEKTPEQVAETAKLFNPDN